MQAPPRNASALRSILVLCVGNHCRSAMAEVLLQAAVGPEIRVESAGLDALVGMPADPEAQQVMAEHGHDLSRHRGRQLTPAMILAADLVLVMDQDQKAACEAMVPSARGRVFLLGHWLAPSGQAVPDPFQGGPEAFRGVFELLRQSIESWRPCLASIPRSA